MTHVAPGPVWRGKVRLKTDQTASSAELAERTGLLTYFSALEDPQQSGKVVILQLK
jgi:hypothetical protein